MSRIRIIDFIRQILMVTHYCDSGGKTTLTDEEELDKLLLGLDKLTETLPDLNCSHSSSTNSASATSTSPSGTPTYSQGYLSNGLTL